MTVDFAITCSLVRPGRPRYPVLVHRAAALLRASFRPHLAMTPLRFANPSPPSGWVEDLHLQAVVHARHTGERPPARAAFLRKPEALRPRRRLNSGVDLRDCRDPGHGSNRPRLIERHRITSFLFVAPRPVMYGHTGRQTSRVRDAGKPRQQRPHRRRSGGFRARATMHRSANRPAVA